VLRKEDIIERERRIHLAPLIPDLIMERRTSQVERKSMEFMLLRGR